MKKYRQRAEHVTAEQFTGDELPISRVLITVETRSGTATVAPGDWFVFYPKDSRSPGGGLRIMTNAAFEREFEEEA